MLPGSHGKSWNLKFKISRHGKSWTWVMESYGKVMEKSLNLKRSRAKIV